MSGSPENLGSETTPPATPRVEPSEPTSDETLRQIADTLRGLKFGTVTIVVQDGVVIQIERTEKRRIRKGDGLRKP